MSEYELDQLFAEAVHRIGCDPVGRYLTAAARRVGWPIPPEYRHQIITGLALPVKAKASPYQAGTGTSEGDRGCQVLGQGRAQPEMVPLSL